MKPPSVVFTVVCTSFPGERASGLSEGRAARPSGFGVFLPRDGHVWHSPTPQPTPACPQRGPGLVTQPHLASGSAFVQSWACWGHSDSHGSDDLNFWLMNFLKAAVNQKSPWVTSLSQLGPEWDGDSVVLLYNIMFVLKSELEGLPWWSSDLDSALPTWGIHTRKIPLAM